MMFRQLKECPSQSIHHSRVDKFLQEEIFANSHSSAKNVQISGVMYPKWGVLNLTVEHFCEGSNCNTRLSSTHLSMTELITIASLCNYLRSYIQYIILGWDVTNCINMSGN